MKRVVMLTEQEWRGLAVRLGRALFEALTRDGFVLAETATGKPTDRAQDYIVGVLASEMPVEDGN